MKELFEKATKLLTDGAGAVKPEYLLIGIPALLAVLFVVFALAKLGSRARRETKLLKLLSAQVTERGISDAEDAAGVGKALSANPRLANGWRRFCASETLTAYDAFKGKARPARSVLFGTLCGIAVLAGMAFLFLYQTSTDAAIVAYGVTVGTVMGLTAVFAALAAAFVLILRAISARQAKRLGGAERAFAFAVNNAFPPAKKNRILRGAAEPAPVQRSVRLEEVKAEHVEETPETPAPAEKAPISEEVPPAPPVEETKPEDGTVAVRSENSVDEIIRKINEVRTNGASIQTMQQIAMLLQKEREKKENKTVAQQRRLNEALAELLRAMSRYQK